MKHLKTRSHYLETLHERRVEKELQNFKPILETYAMDGPFKNELRWGDSFLGRILHSIVRKAVIGTKLVRVKFVAERLIQAMDGILMSSLISSLSKEELFEYNKAVISEFLIAIKEAVEAYAKGDKSVTIKDIIGYVDQAIEKLEGIEDLENKNELLRQLNDFKKFLEKFKDVDDAGAALDAEEKAIENKEQEAKGSDGSIGFGPESDKNSPTVLYPVMVKILTALSKLLLNYKTFKVGGKSGVSTTSADPLSNIIVTKGGETIEAIQKDKTINKYGLSIDEIVNANRQVLKSAIESAQKLKTQVFKITLAKGLKINLSKLSTAPAPKKESFLYETGPISGGSGGSPVGIGSGAGTGRNVATGAESHLTQAWSKLKTACEVLESSKEKGIGITDKFLNDLLSKSKEKEGKEQIMSLFIEVERFLTGDKKATINAPQDPLYKESLEIISDKNKKVIVAEKIARFTLRVKQFDGKGLYGSLGDVGKNLQEYVESFKLLDKMTLSAPKKEEKPKEKKEEAKESFLLRYNSFMNYRIFEADETEAEGESDSPGSKVKKYYDENCEFDKFLVTKEEIEKIKTTLEKKEAENKDSVVINGKDPVLDVVRCFNKAYTLHTSQTIPSNRTDGAVSNAIFSEYTCFGNGDMTNAGKSGGPYRNNAIFIEWEEGVRKVIGNKQYQKIFNVGTKLRVGDEMIDKAGSNLLKFMNNMLDGDELYKSGDSRSEKGAQAKFLEEYFGIAEGSNAESLSFETGPKSEEEIKGIQQNANSIKPINLKAVPDPIAYTKPSDLQGTFLVLQCSVKGAPTEYFMYIQKVLNDVAQITYCRSSYHMMKYISKSRMGQKVSSDDPIFKVKDNKDKDGNIYKISATTMSIAAFIDAKGQFKNSKTLRLTSIVKKKTKEGKIDNLQKETETASEKLLQSCRFLSVIDFGKTPKKEEYARVQISKSDQVDQFIRTEGGFTGGALDSIRNDLQKVKIVNT
jgi:hypothetical protein